MKDITARHQPFGVTFAIEIDGELSPDRILSLRTDIAEVSASIRPICNQFGKRVTAGYLYDTTRWLSDHAKADIEREVKAIVEKTFR